MSFDPQNWHAVYVQTTGLPLRYQAYYHERVWYEFAKEFTQDDLKLVVAYLKRLYRDPEKAGIRKAILRFSHLIERGDRFNEYLAEARAVGRVKPPSARDRILAASGRPQSQPDACATAAEILQRQEFLKLLAQSRKT